MGKGKSNGKTIYVRKGETVEDATNRQMQKEMSKHFFEIDKKIESFMRANGYARSEDYGLPDTYLEKDTLQNIKSLLKDYNMGYNLLTDDDSIAILYKDGTIVFGEDILSEGKKIKLSNIDSVIYSNGSTTTFAGKHIEVYNVRERLPYKNKGYESYRSIKDRYNDEDDIRVDFTKIRR